MVRLSMDEIINAVCFHLADRRRVQPTEVEVQLAWDEDTGFTAEAWVQGRSQYLIESNLLEAIEQYMYNEYNRRVFRSYIKLDLDEEIFAEIADH